MKIINFDALGNLTVSVKKMGVDLDGNPVEQVAQHDIQASQLKAHLPMFLADMSADEKAEAAAIIAEQNAE